MAAMNTETIRAELRKLNISEVAEHAGMTRQAISRFINTPARGLHSTSADKIVRAIKEIPKFDTEAIRSELKKLNLLDVAKRAGVSHQGLVLFLCTPGIVMNSTISGKVIKAIQEMRATKGEPA